MTEEERIAEQAKSMASSVYRQLDEAQRAEDYIRLVHSKWSDHPAYKHWHREMMLDKRLSEFLSRQPMTRA